MDKKQIGLEKGQLTHLKNNEYFISIFNKIVRNQTDISIDDQEYILSCAIIFFRYYDLDKRYKSYFKLGYYIVLKYSLLFKDYRPLYDISLQIGFYPISDFLIRKGMFEIDAFQDQLINRSVRKRYLSYENYIETLEQHASTSAILERVSRENIAYIAPTSYGKSSIIKKVITQGNFQRIAIIVPTKSLLIQTYNDIKVLNLDFKLIQHDEMYSGNERFIGILTQERATRLITKNNIDFDILFIDEAHNLLHRDARSYVLSRLIQLNYHKNPNQKLVYLSPLINNIENVMLSDAGVGSFFSKNIKYDFKVYDIFLFEKSKSYSYDKFTGVYHDLSKATTFYDYIIQNSKKKNFIYQLRPKLIEKLARELSQKLMEVHGNAELEKIVKTLKDEVHPSFYLVDQVKKGIIYLHGKIPNLIKEYLEYAFKNVAALKYIIANQVILEGINLPIETLFVTSANKLQGKELVNLIGRVNRLNYVFSGENLDLLISDIHFLNSLEYQGDDDIKNKIALLRDHSFQDIVQNPLLKTYDIENLKIAAEYLEKRKAENENILLATKMMISTEDLDEKGKIKKYLVENSIDEFYKDVDLAAEIIMKNMKEFSFAESMRIVDAIRDIFITGNDGNIKDFEIERLKNAKAVNYYNYFLEVIQQQSLREKISSTANYFKIKASSDDPQLFIGSSYGEEVRTSAVYLTGTYLSKVYVNLKTKTATEWVNLAVVKVKIEEDFVSYKLNKLIVYLYDFQLLPDDYYFNHVYGTNDLKLIDLIRFGLNVSIVKKLEKDGQIKNLELDNNGNLDCNADFKVYLSRQSELFKFEVNKFL